MPLFSYWHWEALVGSANISLTLILALGSPSVQHHMAYIGTPVLPALWHNVFIECSRLHYLVDMCVEVVWGSVVADV